MLSLLCTAIFHVTVSSIQCFIKLTDIVLKIYMCSHMDRHTPTISIFPVFWWGYQLLHDCTISPTPINVIYTEMFCRKTTNVRMMCSEIRKLLFGHLFLFQEYWRYMNPWQKKFGNKCVLMIHCITVLLMHCSMQKFIMRYVAGVPPMLKIHVKFLNNTT